MKFLDRKKQRKLKTVFAYSCISLILFVIIFFACFLLYTLARNRLHLISPLAGITREMFRSNPRAKIVELLQNHNVLYKEVTINGEEATVTLQNGAVAILDTKKDMEKQITSLQLTIADLTIEGKQFQRLDFRFERPVVTF